MVLKKVAFLSSCGRGLSEDLKLVKNHLEKFDHIHMHYFFRNSTAGKGFQKRAVGISKKQFCVNEQDYVCIDSSLPKDLEGKDKYKRILLLTPYDYIFKMEGLSENEKEKFQGFTHIICGSPFVKNTLQKNYNVDGVELIEDCILPFAYRMNEEKQKEKVREKIEYFFPAAKGKKIFSLLVMGKLDTETEEYDFSSFFEKLPEDYFVLMNNEVMLDGLDSSFINKIGCVKNLMQASDLLYVTDLLCTDSGQLATTFVSTGKRVFDFSIKSNWFSKYMQKHYPELTISKVEELEKILQDSKEVREAETKFYKEFCYESEKDSCEVVSEILTKKK